MIRTVAIVQARMESTRLPGKVLADLGGRPLLASVLERVRACPGLDAVVLAVPETPANDALADVAAAWDVPLIRGPHEDVLARYVQAADATRADVILRVTGDCPLWDPALGARAIYYQRRTGCAYVGDLRLPGLDVEVFVRDMLRGAHGWYSARDPAREHVLADFAKDCDLEAEPDPEPEPDLVVTRWAARKRWWPWLAVDTADDLARVRALAAQLPVGRRVTGGDGFGWRATWWAWRAAGRP